jgi:hypothetical protein
VTGSHFVEEVVLVDDCRDGIVANKCGNHTLLKVTLINWPGDTTQVTSASIGTYFATTALWKCIDGEG